MIKSQYRLCLNRLLPDLFILIEHLKFLYTDACSMRNKLLELEGFGPSLIVVRLGSMSPTNGVMYGGLSAAQEA